MSKIISNALSQLGENARWCKDTNEFFWTDILSGTVYAVNIDTLSVRTVIKTSFLTGAFLFTPSCELLLFTEKGIFLSPSIRDFNELSEDSLKLIFPVSFPRGTRFNDAIGDFEGKALAGVKTDYDRDGYLVRYDFLGKKSEVLLEGLKISNGMGFSPDKKTLYHIDSGFGSITAYDYTPYLPLSNPRVIYVSNELEKVPDGMTVDSDGNILFACWGGGKIIKISPEGNILKSYKLDQTQVSSVSLGGNSFDILFSTSAYVGLGDRRNQSDGASCILKADASGKPDFPVIV